MAEINADGPQPEKPKASAPRPRAPARKPSGANLAADGPPPLPEVPTSHTLFEMVKSGQLLGFVVVFLVFIFVVVLAFRCDATYATVVQSAKELLIPIVTLYLGFIFGRRTGKRSK